METDEIGPVLETACRCGWDRPTACAMDHSCSTAFKRMTILRSAERKAALAQNASIVTWQQSGGPNLRISRGIETSVLSWPKNGRRIESWACLVAFRHRHRIEGTYDGRGQVVR